MQELEKEKAIAIAGKKLTLAKNNMNKEKITKDNTKEQKVEEVKKEKFKIRKRKGVL